MLNNNIQKNAISKVKSLTNLKSIYARFTLSHQKEQFTQIKPKKRKLTRLEQINLTDEERRLIYDRRSPAYKIRKQRQQSTSPYLSDRKLIKFLLPFSVRLEKKQEPSEDIYIYNNITTKRVTNTRFVVHSQNLSKKGGYCMSNFATMNANKLFDEKNSDYMSDNAYYANERIFKNSASTTKYTSSIQTATKNPQQGERQRLPSSLSDSLHSIVSRKALKYRMSGKGQLFTMMELERWARDYPQARDNWGEWCRGMEGREFMEWIQEYAQQFNYGHWNPFTFDRGAHREKFRIDY